MLKQSPVAMKAGDVVRGETRTLAAVYAAEHIKVLRYGEALKHIVTVLGPEGGTECGCCPGCNAEMREALDMAKVALGGDVTKNVTPERFCPKCGSDDIEHTEAGIGIGKDIEKAECLACRWSGTPSELRHMASREI